MRDYCYCIKFAGGREETVCTRCRAAAIILAQAEQIKKDNRYDDIVEVIILD